MVLWLDADTAGRAAVERLARRFHFTRVGAVRLREGQDVNDLHREG